MGSGKVARVRRGRILRRNQRVFSEIANSHFPLGKAERNVKTGIRYGTCWDVFCVFGLGCFRGLFAVVYPFFFFCLFFRGTEKAQNFAVLVSDPFAQGPCPPVPALDGIHEKR